MGGSELSEEVVSLVYRLASILHQRNSDIPLEDLSQEGMMSALLAVRVYDKTKGAKLTTWVTLFVRRSLFKFIRKQRRSIASGDLSDVEDRLDPNIIFGDMPILKERLSPIAWKMVNLIIEVAPRRLTRIDLAQELGVELGHVRRIRAEILAECLDLFGGT